MNIMTSARMTEADYDRERARIRETYGDSTQQAGVRWEHALAMLFYRSGWTIEQLAAKEGKTKKYIGRLLVFGRFLRLPPDSGDTPEIRPTNLSEYRFRYYWERTGHLGGSGPSGGNERIRFREIARLMQADLKFGGLAGLPRGAGGKIREHFADGKWHSAEKITETIGVGEAINATLRHLIAHPISHGMRSERKQVGNSFHYRFFKQEHNVSIDELTTKLKPIIDELMVEGRKKHIATVSQGTILKCAGLIKNLLDEWAAE
jgi:hypothetical protein